MYHLLHAIDDRQDFSFHDSQAIGGQRNIKY